MCCAPNNYKRYEINGECPDCGGDTVDGDAFESCGYSQVDCETCRAAGCDGSC